MTDDIDTREEERILRSMSRKPVPQANPRAARTSVRINPPLNPQPETTRPQSYHPSTSNSLYSHSSPPNSANFGDQVEHLQLKKRTILGTITTTRRDLDDVRAEINKLKSKEAELMGLIEKREIAVQQLNQQIESLEHTGHLEKQQAEEEKARRIREEVERRRREEEEALRQKQKEEEGERSLQSSLSSKSNPPLSNSSHSTEELNSDGLNSEELRIMRAMTRARGSHYSKATTTQTTAPKAPTQQPVQPAIEPAWKEQERIRDAERANRIAEENRRKEAEKKQSLLNENNARQAEQQRITAIQNRDGQMHTFTTPVIYDFDADIRISGDFTDWQEIPISTPIDNNFTYSITLPVSPGVHFYRFKIGGKWDVNKNLLTGVASTGEVMNKIVV